MTFPARLTQKELQARYFAAQELKLLKAINQVRELIREVMRKNRTSVSSLLNLEAI